MKSILSTSWLNWSYLPGHWIETKPVRGLLCLVVVCHKLFYPHIWGWLPWHCSTPWWRYQMEIISALLALCAGNSPVTDEFPSQSPVTRSLDIFFICAWINGWVNNREAGDLRRHHAHYDVTVLLRTVLVPRKQAYGICFRHIYGLMKPCDINLYHKVSDNG